MCTSEKKNVGKTIFSIFLHYWWDRAGWIDKEEHALLHISLMGNVVSKQTKTKRKDSLFTEIITNRNFLVTAFVVDLSLFSYPWSSPSPGSVLSRSGLPSPCKTSLLKRIKKDAMIVAWQRNSEKILEFRCQAVVSLHHFMHECVQRHPVFHNQEGLY